MRGQHFKSTGLEIPERCVPALGRGLRVVLVGGRCRNRSSSYCVAGLPIFPSGRSLREISTMTVFGAVLCQPDGYRLVATRSRSRRARPECVKKMSATRAVSARWASLPSSMFPVRPRGRDGRNGRDELRWCHADGGRDVKTDHEYVSACGFAALYVPNGVTIHRVDPLAVGLVWRKPSLTPRCVATRRALSSWPRTSSRVTDPSSRQIVVHNLQNQGKGEGFHPAGECFRELGRRASRSRTSKSR